MALVFGAPTRVLNSLVCSLLFVNRSAFQAHGRSSAHLLSSLKTSYQGGTGDQWSAPALDAGPALVVLMPPSLLLSTLYSPLNDLGSLAGNQLAIGCGCISGSILVCWSVCLAYAIIRLSAAL